METLSLTVDIADQADVQAKLAEAENWLAEHDQKREQLVRLVARLRAISNASGSPSSPAPEPGRRPATGVASETSRDDGRATPGNMHELVVQVVNREMRSVRARDVAQMLRDEGHAVATESVSNALWYAAEKAEVIQRVGRGSYAPKGYKQPLSAVDLATGAAAGIAGAALLSSAFGGGSA